MIQKDFKNVYTFYNGREYRSQAEALFARLLDCWLVDNVIDAWHYEPDSFTLKLKNWRGEDVEFPYTPDFKTFKNGIVTYYEVKGIPIEYDIQKWKAFKEQTPHKLVVVCAGKLPCGVNKRIRISRVAQIQENMNKEYRRYKLI